MEYLKERGAVLLQFGLCMLVRDMRPRALAYYLVARRDYLLPRFDAMYWVVSQVWLDDEQLEQSVTDNFIDMMNRAWGDEDDLEWLGRLR